MLKELKLREKFSNSALFFQAEFHLKGEYNPALKKKKKNKKKKAGKGQEKYVMTAIVLIIIMEINLLETFFKVAFAYFGAEVASNHVLVIWVFFHSAAKSKCVPLLPC